MNITGSNVGPDQADALDVPWNLLLKQQLQLISPWSVFRDYIITVNLIFSTSEFLRWATAITIDQFGKFREGTSHWLLLIVQANQRPTKWTRTGPLIILKPWLAKKLDVR